MYKFKEQMERELQRIIFLKKRIKPAEENDKRGLMAEGGGGRNVRIYQNCRR